MKKTIKQCVAWAVLAAAAVGAAAQEYPTRPVKIVVPQTPGGASDTLARIVAQHLSERWGQPVMIENRPGAGGNVGMESVARSPADGYALLMSYVGTHAINGALYKKLSFDPEKDFTPLASLATLPFVAVTSAGSSITSMPELIAAAKNERLTYGSAGNGSVNHLLGEMVNTAAGIKLEHVPYRGAAPAMQDLLGGQIDLVFASLPSVAGSIRSGTLQPIAVTSAKRPASFANIPTIAEAGLQDFDVNPWFGLFGPAGIPPQIVAKINTDINALLRTDDLVEQFALQGAEPYITDPVGFSQVLKTDIVKWGAVVTSSGASVD